MHSCTILVHRRNNIVPRLFRRRNFLSFWDGFGRFWTILDDFGARFVSVLVHSSQTIPKPFHHELNSFSKIFHFLPQSPTSIPIQSTTCTKIVHKFRILTLLQRKQAHSSGYFSIFQSWHAPCFISCMCAPVERKPWRHWNRT